jgi:ABC-2 type transport system ATP-binding protein
MSEMEHTADELIVVGRGELIAAEPLTTFAARGRRRSVTVRTPEPDALAAVLGATGATVLVDDAETLTVTGIEAARVGELAHRRGLELYELSTNTPSLEEAFMELAVDRAEYVGGDAR